MAHQPKRLLILQNPGRMSRHWMQGITNAAAALGLEHMVFEIGAWRLACEVAGGEVGRGLHKILAQQRIGAVVSYTCNGATEMRASHPQSGLDTSLFDAMGIPHLMFWWDHPQWAQRRATLGPDLRPVLSSRNVHHFLKAPSAAQEIGALLGWPNCHGLPPGADLEMLAPTPASARPEFDVVAIIGGAPAPDPVLDPFLLQDAPDREAILDVVALRCEGQLDAIWQRLAPASLMDSLRRMGQAWIERKRRASDVAAWRHFQGLAPAHGAACGWLRERPEAYFDALEALWGFGSWQRTFIIRYLARYFRVGVFGSDWSSVGVGGSSQWVEFGNQASTYARGRVALNILQGHDEEGLSVREFEILSLGVPAALQRSRGIAEAFEIGREVECFDSPAACRAVVERLLGDPGRSAQMAAAARQRILRDHTWAHRLAAAFELAGLPLSDFREPEAAAPGRRGDIVLSMSMAAKWPFPAPLIASAA